MTYTNSSMVVHRNLSPNNSGQRAHTIDRISPHCVVGQCTAESLGSWFARSSTQASSNYGIDKDGRVGLYVEEKNRSWCTSSSANDNRAVTIECASDTTSPYRMNDAVYQTLIRLCADICKRNGKSKLVWISDKAKALAYTPAGHEMLLTVHCWFANKSCPGDWLLSRMSDLAAKVNAILAGGHPVLQKGCTGDDVEEYQKGLLSLGYDLGTAGADGDFGTKTDEATRAFQKDQGLYVDGVAGDDTWTAWEKAVKGVTPETPAEDPDEAPEPDKPTADVNYVVRVKSRRPIYKEPPVEVGTLNNGAYTIIEERDGYGKLKSGVGWIDLQNTEKV